MAIRAAPTLLDEFNPSRGDYDPVEMVKKVKEAIEALFVQSTKDPIPRASLKTMIKYLVRINILLEMESGGQASYLTDLSSRHAKRFPRTICKLFEFFNRRLPAVLASYQSPRKDHPRREIETQFQQWEQQEQQKKEVKQVPVQHSLAALLSAERSQSIGRKQQGYQVKTIGTKQGHQFHTINAPNVPQHRVQLRNIAPTPRPPSPKKRKGAFKPILGKRRKK